MPASEFPAAREAVELGTMVMAASALFSSRDLRKLPLVVRTSGGDDVVAGVDFPPLLEVHRGRFHRQGELAAVIPFLIVHHQPPHLRACCRRCLRHLLHLGIEAHVLLEAKVGDVFIKVLKKLGHTPVLRLAAPRKVPKGRRLRGCCEVEIVVGVLDVHATRSRERLEAAAEGASKQASATMSQKAAGGARTYSVSKPTETFGFSRAIP